MQAHLHALLRRGAISLYRPGNWGIQGVYPDKRHVGDVLMPARGQHSYFKRGPVTLQSRLRFGRGATFVIDNLSISHRMRLSLIRHPRSRNLFHYQPV